MYRSKSFGLNSKTKPQTVIIGSSKLIAGSRRIITIYHNCNDSVKNLGEIVDQNMSWTQQLSETIRKMFVFVASIHKLRNFFPIPTEIALAQSLLLSILGCYLDLREEQLNKLERLQKIMKT